MKNIRILSLLKLIGIMAIGFALARWALSDARLNKTIADVKKSEIEGARLAFAIVIYEVRPFIASMALVAGVVTWFDRSSRTSPRAWGIGRWTLAAWAFLILANFAYPLLEKANRNIHQYPPRSPLQSADFTGHASLALMSTLYTQQVLILLGAAAATKLARWPGDPAPDFTEWAGRGALGTFVILTLGVDLAIPFFI